MTRNYSLWLVPAEPARSLLAETIAELATELDAPTFTPHITLAGVESTPSEVRRAVDLGARQHRPLSVVAGTTTHDAEWSRALVIEIGDPQIHELADHVCRLLAHPFDPEQLKPHVSLLYRGDLAVEVRRQLAERYDFTGHQFGFDTLVAMHAPNGSEDVASWDTSISAALSGG
jgi:hypothetical protein